MISPVRGHNYPYNNVDRRSVEVKERQTAPLLENFINCCNDSQIENLNLILQNNLEHFKTNPDKIINGYLNYCATGQEKVFEALLNFTQQHNIAAKDETFDCFDYLFNKGKYKTMDLFLENNIWSLPNLIAHMKMRAEGCMRHEEAKKTNLLKMSTELEKNMLENEIGHSTVAIKPRFKI